RKRVPDSSEAPLREGAFALGEELEEEPGLEAGAPETIAFTIDERSAGQRGDVVLAERAGVSRAQVQRWIEAERVRVAGRSVRASRAVVSGERIEAWPAVPEPMSLVPQAIALVVLHEDADLIV